ncbi:porin [Azospirillum sp. sgz301742]
MNRYLLAGCAVVALALGSGAANAQAKFEVKVGGDVFAEWGYVEQDRDAGLRSTEMRNRFRVNIIPSAKADNGLEYGARIRIRADNNNAAGRTLTQDRAYIFAQGGFGQVRIGTSNTYNDETIVSRPIDYLPFGLFDQALSYIGGAQALGGAGLTSGADVAGGQLNSAMTGGTFAWPTFGDVATRIVYFSPRLAGFQLGASYTPRNDDSQNSVNRLKVGSVASTAAFQPSQQDLWELGANYDATFGGVAVKAGAGYYGGKASDPATGAGSFKDLRAWQAGAQVGFAGFTLGGSYTDWGKSGLNKSGVIAPFQDSANVWTVGGQYTVGPIVVGAGFTRGQDAGSVLVAGKRRVDVYEIGASYTVAPGFAVQAQYDYFKADTDLPATTATGSRDDKGSIVILRTTLAF